MKIALDATYSLGRNLSGVGVYSRQILSGLAGAHPEPATIRAALSDLGATDMLKVTYAVTPRLAAMLRTPRGTVTL